MGCPPCSISLRFCGRNRRTTLILLDDLDIASQCGCILLAVYTYAMTATRYPNHLICTSWPQEQNPNVGCRFGDMGKRVDFGFATEQNLGRVRDERLSAPPDEWRL